MLSASGRRRTYRGGREGGRGGGEGGTLKFAQIKMNACIHDPVTVGTEESIKAS